MEEADVAIIGAGVVGLACAARLSAMRGVSIIVLEKNDSFGRETSSRNSEVIHSGIYYPEGSLKARLCVEGSELLYGICARYSIPCRKYGKLIAATDASEVPILEKLFARGLRNGANGIRLIDKADIGRIEPDVSALAAIHSPGTGVLDTHSLMKHLFNEARSAGAMFLYGAEASSIEKDKNGFMVGIKPEGAKVRVRVVINSAGLMSDRVAELAGIDIDRAGYRLKYCKGSYFYYSKASPVNTLIYPVPHEGSAGLGIHATLDVAGRLRLGPDAEYMGSIDYNVDAGKAELFYEKASRMITRIEKNALVPDQAGVRPKLYGPNEKVRDFVITEEGDKGLDGLINLIGIESPGFTASPAIAAMVEKLVKGVLN